MKTTRPARVTLAAIATTALSGVAAYAIAPPAGSVIGNQASATYQNASGDTVRVTSNRVETVVQQVAGVTIAADNDETVAPGGKAFLPHVVTNDGNGTDVFDLSAVETAGGLSFTSIRIFADADFDGVADSTTPITVTPALTRAGTAGSSFGIVVEAVAAAGAAAGATDDITVTALSQFDGTTADTDTDTVTVSNDAVVELVKSMTVATGGDGVVGPGDTVTITLTYSSTGLVSADDLVVSDTLDARLEYDDGSARWSDVATGLSDADDGAEATNGNGETIDFQVADNASGTSDEVQFTVSAVPSGRTGRVTFTATITDAAAAGEIANVATQTVNGNAYPPSNRSTITVEEVRRVTAADRSSATYQADPDGPLVGAGGNLTNAVVSATDDDGEADDEIRVSTDVSQGGSIRFEVVLTNQSNVSDRIAVSAADTDFPTGTTFELLAADNATPLAGPVGPIAPGASTTVNLIATLPSDASPAAAGATNYTATVTAVAEGGGASNFVTAEFTGAVTAAAVDLQNQGGTGDGPDDGTSQLTFATDPGSPVSYVVTIENLGPNADTYDLSAPVPAGWTVTFRLPDGTPVTNTGAIPGGGSLDVTVVLTPPAGAPPGDTPVTVTAASPSSGQSDSLVNTITVNAIVDLALAATQTVQVAPGGVSDIPHTLTNEGNVGITQGALTLDGTFSTFSGTIFYDRDRDGTVDPGEPVVDDVADLEALDPGILDAGGTAALILRVQVPSTGTVGLSERETLRVATSLNGGAATDGDAADNAVTDTVVIVSGDLTLVKEQAVDPACDGNPGTFDTVSVQAEPGACIRYRITASNSGSSDAAQVAIRDTVPSFTTFTACPDGGGTDQCTATVTPGGSAVSAPGEGATGAVSSTHGTLIPGQLATLEFTVKIDE